MELFQIRYFYEVAVRGGLAPAAKNLFVSLPAISKAISNLESELKCQLFDRQGRSLKLSDEGKHFLKRADSILQLVSVTTNEMRGQTEVSELAIAGREVFLNHFGISIAKIFKKQNQASAVRFRSSSGAEAISTVDRGDAHLAILIQKPPPEWRSVALARLNCIVAVSRKHVLAKRQRQERAIPIAELLKHEFISPNSNFFGRTSEGVSIDGWRDDLHPRNIGYTVESLTLYGNLASLGAGVVYIPDFFAHQLDLVEVKVEGITPQPRQNIWLTGKRINEQTWLRKIFEESNEL